MSINVRLTGLVPIAVFVLAIAGCDSPLDVDQTGKEEVIASAPQPETFTVVRTRVATIYEAPGTVVAPQSFVVTSTINGFIHDIVVKEGEKIEANALLVRIDPAKVKQAIAQAQASVSSAAAEFEDADDDVRKYRELVKENAISEERLRKARLRQKKARANLEEARAALQAHQSDLGYTNIRSPVEALVVERFKSVGDLSSPGTPILRLESLTNREFETWAPESLLSHLAEGAQVIITLDALHQRVKGTITHIVDSSDPVTRTAKVKIALPADVDLMPGLFGHVAFVTGYREQITVPGSAIVTRAGVQGVYVLQADGDSRFISARLGARVGEQRVVLAGLRVSDRVLVHPPRSPFN
ncbi:MAG: efflux RND transporter periplasmic adaptor subunit [Thiogranum sp.]